MQSAVAGLISGGAYALLGVCIVLLYRMVGVLNIAQAAIGCLGAYTMLVLYGLEVPLVLGVLAGMVISGLAGAILGWVMSYWFAEASVQTRSSVTIAMFIGLLALGFRVFGDDSRPIPQFFDGAYLEIAGVLLSYSTLLLVLGAVVIAWLVNSFLNRTLIGTYLRALAERPTAAELLGVPARALTVGVWALAGALAAFAISFILPTRTPNFGSLSMLVLPALAAALVGSFKSFPTTIIGGLLIGVLESVGSLWGFFSAYRQAFSFLVTLVVLLWLQRREVWDAAR
jgi:branched-chain amino acid transport system permease protein